uniref:PDZ domain-containing protein n=1 Tax=Triticum urartu TaxID=4572 RepID=A0A8R7URQ5_TRIUA
KKYNLSISYGNCVILLLQVPDGPADKHLEPGDVLIR